MSTESILRLLHEELGTLHGRVIGTLGDQIEVHLPDDAVEQLVELLDALEDARDALGLFDSERLGAVVDAVCSAPGGGRLLVAVEQDQGEHAGRAGADQDRHH